MIKYCYCDAIRGKKNEPTNVSFAYTEQNDGVVVYAAAITHPRDEFSRKIGRAITTGRLMNYLENPNRPYNLAGMKIRKPEGTNLYGVKKLIVDDFNLRNYGSITCVMD